MMLIEVINKGSVPYCASNDNNSTGISLSEIIFSFMLEKYIVCDACGLRSPSFGSSSVLYIACLCQSIEINNNKHVYRQSQVRKSTDSGVKWAECSLIIGTGCRVQVFSLILNSSVGLSASIQSAGDLVSGTPGSNPAFSRGTQLVSFRFEYRLPVPEHRN